MSARLAAVRAPADLVSGLAMGWHFAGLAMLIFGLLALWLASVAQRAVNVRFPVGLIGAAYILFALGTAAAVGFDFIEIVFLAPGVLLTAAALLPER